MTCWSGLGSDNTEDQHTQKVTRTCCDKDRQYLSYKVIFVYTLMPSGSNQNQREGMSFQKKLVEFKTVR